MQDYLLRHILHFQINWFIGIHLRVDKLLGYGLPMIKNNKNEENLKITRDVLISLIEG